MPDTPKRQLSVSYSSTRLSYPGVSNPATPATGGKDEDFAAVKMQSAFRGHQVRFGQEEQRRVQWLNYYIEVGNYDEAMSLCISEEEKKVVQAAASGQKVQLLPVGVPRSDMPDDLITTAVSPRSRCLKVAFCAILVGFVIGALASFVLRTTGQAEGETPSNENNGAFEAAAAYAVAAVPTGR